MALSIMDPEADRLARALAARTGETLTQAIGKGRHHAGRNFGNCFSYALVKISGQPFLFKGDDFAQISISAAA